MRGHEELQRQIDDMAHEVVARCSERGVTVASAESLTAGMVCSSIAGVPGASEILRGGAVTYVNEIKHAVLGVSSDSLERFTEVSHPVAREMATGARNLFSTDIAVSLTGYAGPTGGTEENPVGTVYLGIASDSGVRSVREVFDGDRLGVRMRAAIRALQLILECLDECGEIR